MNGAHEAGAPREKPSGLYHTPTRSCNLPQVTDFKQFPLVPRLTLSKTGSYTSMMASQRVSLAVLTAAATAAAWTAHPAAQPIQRSLYVSVVNDAGAPVPNLGPADFIVREDNVTREVLKVAPADE